MVDFAAIRLQSAGALACAALTCLPSLTIAANRVTVSQGTNFSVDAHPDGRLVMDLQGMLWLLAPEGGKAMRLTGPRDDIRQPVFSPDGTRLLYQSFRDGAWHIAVSDADGSKRIDLTNGSADHRDPAWLPDGNTVVFSSDRSGNYELWQLPLAGGEARRLTDHPADDYAPAVAADGTLAFVSERDGRTGIYIYAPPAASAGVNADQTGTTEADNTAARTAPTDPGNAALNAAPKLVYSAPAGRIHGLRFSPAGTHLAFVQAAGRTAFPAIARNELAVIELASGTVTVLSNNEDVFPLRPDWIDEDTLLYTADGVIKRRQRATSQVSRVPFTARLNVRKPKGARRTPLAFRADQQRVLGIVSPVTAPDGRQVLFQALGDLWVNDPEVGLAPLTQDSFVERDPAVSPDGAWLAYSSDRGGDMQIWLRDLRAGVDTQVTTKARGPRHPTFSHDGLQLAWQDVGPVGTGDFRVYVTDLLTGEQRRLRHAPAIWPGAMSWSTDGRYLTVAELVSTSTRFREGRNRLVRVGVAAEDIHSNPLPDGLVTDAGPVAAPGGYRTALIIDGALHIIATGPDGTFQGPPVKIYDGLAAYPSWNGDGTQLTFLGARGLAQMRVTSDTVSPVAIDLKWRNTYPRKRQIVHAGRLYNGMGNNYRTNVDIVIENGRIVTVKRHRPHPGNVVVIDAGRFTVLPGLIDQHAHFQPHEGNRVGRSLLAYGVTTVVEPGGEPWRSRELLESWGSGRTPGPRLVYAGPQLDGMRRSFDFGSHITSSKRLGWEFDRAATLDYGLIKTYTRLSGNLQAEAIERAHEFGVPVTAHAAFRSVALGGDHVEHLRGTSRTGYSSKQSDALRIYGDIIGLLGANETALTPTVVVAGGFFRYLLDNPELLATRQMLALYSDAERDGLLTFAKMMGRDEELLAYGHNNALAGIKRLHDGGARIVAGTDSPIFPYGLALIVELINYQQSGMAPWEVLESATSASAEVIGAGDIAGSIRKGNVADFVIVDGDPLSDVTELLNVRGVMRNGNFYSLDALLDDASKNE